MAAIVPAGSATARGQDYVPGELFVGVRPTSDTAAEASTIASYGAIIYHNSDSHYYHIKLAAGADLAAAVSALTARPEVRYAEPNYYVQAAQGPNDHYYITQDTVIGDPRYGNLYQYAPEDVFANLAWTLWKPVRRTVIAIIDSGVDYTHPDLAGKFLRDSQNNIAGYNAIAYPYPNEQESSANDGNGHGTHVAGIAAAEIDNGIGIAGIAGWSGVAGQPDTANTVIMPIQSLQTDVHGKLSGTDQELADGIHWARTNGANVINLSNDVLGHVDAQVIRDEISSAWQAGCVIVAAAGNDGGDVANYPAAYGDCISVAANDSTDELAGFSTWGSWVNVSAPGGQGATISAPTPSMEIFSTWLYGGYAYDWGTSMAAPVVAGEAALLWSQNSNLDNQDVVNIIRNTWDPVTTYPGGNNGAIDGGRVNVYHALEEAATGQSPDAGLTLGPDGYLYGTADGGGTGGLGVVFKMDTAGNVTVIHQFGGTYGGVQDGAYPWGGVTFDSTGSFMWGTTRQGGAHNLGTVYAITTTGATYYIEHSFAGQSAQPSDGSYPYCTLTLGADGYFYGTTYEGGTYNWGTVFRVDSTPTDYKVVYHFGTAVLNDGEGPFGGVVFDGGGVNLWGTTVEGGASGYGTVFAVNSSGSPYYQEHSFDLTHGANPRGGLVTSAAGTTLYGTAEYGGSHGTGAIFSITGTPGSFSDIYDFGSSSYGATDGANPYGQLAWDASHSYLWGTTSTGGVHGLGTVFGFPPSGGTYYVLHNFSGAGGALDPDGATPYGTLLFNPADGYFYGTTHAGGAIGNGQAFRINSAPVFAPIFSFGY